MNSKTSPRTPSPATRSNHSHSSTTSGAGKSFICKILLLDDIIQTFQIPTKANGHVLWEAVCKKLHLLESDYFDLEFMNANGITCWLDRSKLVFKQVAPSGTEARFSFVVKFFPPDPHLLDDEFTRYLFALQIKRDLQAGQLACSETTAALLSAYIVQAEIGDYLEDVYQNNISYLQHLRLIPDQSPRFLNRVLQLHKALIGMAPAEADYHLLDTVRKCEFYGLRLYPAKDHEGIPMTVSVAHNGIIVLQNMIKINLFSWAKIRKISFKRKKFIIKLHADTCNFYNDIVEFYFASRDECKNFWKSCIEHHTFFRCHISGDRSSKPSLVSTGSTYRYSGRTQKELIEYVRENYVKRPPFVRISSANYVKMHAMAPAAARYSNTSNNGSNNNNNSSNSSNNNNNNNNTNNGSASNTVSSNAVHQNTSGPQSTGVSFKVGSACATTVSARSHTSTATSGSHTFDEDEDEEGGALDEEDAEHQKQQRKRTLELMNSRANRNSICSATLTSPRKGEKDLEATTLPGKTLQRAATTNRHDERPKVVQHNTAQPTQLQPLKSNLKKTGEASEGQNAVDYGGVFVGESQPTDHLPEWLRSRSIKKRHGASKKTPIATAQCQTFDSIEQDVGTNADNNDSNQNPHSDAVKESGTPDCNGDTKAIKVTAVDGTGNDISERVTTPRPKSVSSPVGRPLSISSVSASAAVGGLFSPTGGSPLDLPLSPPAKFAESPQHDRKSEKNARSSLFSPPQQSPLATPSGLPESFSKDIFFVANNIQQLLENQAIQTAPPASASTAISETQPSQPDADECIPMKQSETACAQRASAQTNEEAVSASPPLVKPPDVLSPTSSHNRSIVNAFSENEESTVDGEPSIELALLPAPFIPPSIADVIVPSPLLPQSDAQAEIVCASPPVVEAVYVPDEGFDTVDKGCGQLQHEQIVSVATSAFVPAPPAASTNATSMQNGKADDNPALGNDAVTYILNKRVVQSSAESYAQTLDAKAVVRGSSERQQRPISSSEERDSYSDSESLAESISMRNARQRAGGNQSMPMMLAGGVDDRHTLPRRKHSLGKQRRRRKERREKSPCVHEKDGHAPATMIKSPKVWRAEYMNQQRQIVLQRIGRNSRPAAQVSSVKMADNRRANEFCPPFEYVNVYRLPPLDSYSCVDDTVAVDNFQAEIQERFRVAKLRKQKSGATESPTDASKASDAAEVEHSAAVNCESTALATPTQTEEVLSTPSSVTKVEECVEAAAGAAGVSEAATADAEEAEANAEAQAEALTCHLLQCQPVMPTLAEAVAFIDEDSDANSGATPRDSRKSSVGKSGLPIPYIEIRQSTPLPSPDSRIAPSCELDVPVINIKMATPIPSPSPTVENLNSISPASSNQCDVADAAIDEQVKPEPEGTDEGEEDRHGEYETGEDRRASQSVDMSGDTSVLSGDTSVLSDQHDDDSDQNEAHYCEQFGAQQLGIIRLPEIEPDDEAQYEDEDDDEILDESGRAKRSIPQTRYFVGRYEDAANSHDAEEDDREDEVDATGKSLLVATNSRELYALDEESSDDLRQYDDGSSDRDSDVPTADDTGTGTGTNQSSPRAAARNRFAQGDAADGAAGIDGSYIGECVSEPGSSVCSARSETARSNVTTETSVSINTTAPLASSDTECTGIRNDSLSSFASGSNTEKTVLYAGDAAPEEYGRPASQSTMTTSLRYESDFELDENAFPPPPPEFLLDTQDENLSDADGSDDQDGLAGVAPLAPEAYSCALFTDDNK